MAFTCQTTYENMAFMAGRDFKHHLVQQSQHALPDNKLRGSFAHSSDSKFSPYHAESKQLKGKHLKKCLSRAKGQDGLGGLGMPFLRFFLKLANG